MHNVVLNVVAVVIIIIIYKVKTLKLFNLKEVLEYYREHCNEVIKDKEKEINVIIGQDPYFNPHQAHGLAFSVQKDIVLPPSLRNIFKEIENEFNKKFSDIKNGDLSYLAKQGVLLLNSILTVEKGLPLSHKKNFGDDKNIINWEIITDKIISVISNKRKNIVYLLWGKFAKSKEKLINLENNLILKSGHPSPLSVRYFLGNNHFIKTNEYLKEHNLKEIKWIR